MLTTDRVTREVNAIDGIHPTVCIDLHLNLSFCICMIDDCSSPEIENQGHSYW